MTHKLDKPCTLEARMNFINLYECQQHLRLFDTDDALYALEENEIMQNDKPIVDPNWEKEKLEELRSLKYDQNEFQRNQFLSYDIIYKEVAFDSDLEQRQNLDYAINHMEVDEVKDWVASDGMTKLSCTKQDLENINLLLNTKITYVWEIRNPEIKLNIKNATTIEELEKINISYSMPTVA